jgi:hypothetical protein
LYKQLNKKRNNNCLNLNINIISSLLQLLNNHSLMKNIFLYLCSSMLFVFFTYGNVLADSGRIINSPYFSSGNLSDIFPAPGGLKITYEEFVEKMSYYLDMMKEDEEFTEEEYIEIILIDNTYFVFMSNSNPLYKVNTHKDYLDFLQHYMDDILKVLEATEQGCNGGFYSKKHNLCIGGTAPNKNSVYEIID